MSPFSKGELDTLAKMFRGSYEDAILAKEVMIQKGVIPSEVFLARVSLFDKESNTTRSLTKINSCTELETLSRLPYEDSLKRHIINELLFSAKKP